MSSNSDPLETAILFLVFRRPDTTQRVFNAIRSARPKRLYLAADGPRPDRVGEEASCSEVREIISNVDWPCEIKLLFREANLGCRVGVSTAIDWFFDNEEEGIILEDDCLPDQSYFLFCEDLLERYREDNQVMVISGDYFHGVSHKPEYSYFFSRYNHCWGWASWRRAWQYYDRDMSQWPGLRDTDWLICVGDGHSDFEKYWKNIFDLAHAGKIDSWAYRWRFSCWLREGLTALPSINLVKNIGFGQNATHTKSDDDRAWIGRIPLDAISFPLICPEKVERDVVADRWTDLNVVGTKLPL